MALKTNLAGCGIQHYFMIPRPYLFCLFTRRLAWAATLFPVAGVGL